VKEDDGVICITVIVEEDPSYELGFASGSWSAKSAGIEEENPEKLADLAVMCFLRACHSMLLSAIPFAHGWFKGYRAYFDGFIQPEKELEHGNQPDGD
jgi:hypothetical protein